MRDLRVRLIAIALLALALGCGKDDTIVGPERTVPTPTAKSPQETLQKLVFAYVNRDSVQTAAVYDDAYRGTSNDPGAPQPILQFDKNDEVRHVGRLKKDSNIVSVLLDLGQPSTWQRIPAAASDPPDWAVIPIPASRIEIQDNSTQTRYEATNDIIEYTFKPTVSAPGDTTWTVVRWTEFAN